MTSLIPIRDRVELAIAAHLRRAPYIGDGPLRTRRGECKMPHNGVSIFEHWRNLAKAIIEERDEQKQRELVKELSRSYHELFPPE